MEKFPTDQDKPTLILNGTKAEEEGIHSEKVLLRYLPICKFQNLSFLMLSSLAKQIAMVHGIFNGTACDEIY